MEGSRVEDLGFRVLGFGDFRLEGSSIQGSRVLAF